MALSPSVQLTTKALLRPRVARESGPRAKLAALDVTTRRATSSSYQLRTYSLENPAQGCRPKLSIEVRGVPPPDQ